MNEDSADASSPRSWLEKLSQAWSNEPKDRASLLELLQDARQRKLLDADALAMMEGVMRVSEMRVRDVMIHRTQMVIVEADWPLSSLVSAVLESGHSRFPVIAENRDQVIGILLAKDLLPYLTEDKPCFQLEDVLRPTQFIPESKHLNALLKEFRISRLHIAIVVDEYGGVAGLVTVEDLLEEIVGEIDDEHDEEDEALIRLQGDQEFIVKALTPVEDFNAYFQATLPEDKTDTVGGLVMMELGRLPKQNEIVALGHFRFEVMRADNRRLHVLKLQLLGAPPPTNLPPDRE